MIAMANAGLRLQKLLREGGQDAGRARCEVAVWPGVE